MTDAEVLSLIVAVSAKMLGGFMIMPDNFDAKQRLLKRGLIANDHPMNYGTSMVVRPTEKGLRRVS